MNALRALQQQLADAMRASAKPVVASLCGDALADDASRLAVYRHGYTVRLRDALAVEFPGLALMAGRRFPALLDAYVAAHPSRHFNIRWHGEGLAAMLAATSPWRERPELAEMAAFDWAISTAFDAADHAPVDRSALASLAPGDWAGMRLQLLPHAQLIRAHANLDAFRRAADGGQSRPQLRRWRQARFLLVWRPDVQVHYRTVTAEELAPLQAAVAGEPFAALCEHVAARGRAQDALPRMAAWLSRWLDEGLIGGIAPP